MWWGCVRRVERAVESAFGVRSLALMGGLVRGYGRWWSLGEGVECRLGTPILGALVCCGRTDFKDQVSSHHRVYA